MIRLGKWYIWFDHFYKIFLSSYIHIIGHNKYGYIDMPYLHNPVL